MVSACRESATTSDIAQVCLFAACRSRHLGEARRWLGASPRANRKDLAANCKQLGDLDIGATAPDCARDPVACR